MDLFTSFFEDFLWVTSGICFDFVRLKIEILPSVNFLAAFQFKKSKISNFADFFIVIFDEFYVYRICGWIGTNLKQGK